MNAKKAYIQQAAPSMRVDLVLEVYERLLARLRRAKSILAAQPEEARRLVNQCQLAVTGMAAGQEFSTGGLSETFLRLYEFVGHSLSRNEEGGIQDAIDVLQTLQQGFLESRPEAVDLERAGQIPPLDQSRLHFTA